MIFHLLFGVCCHVEEFNVCDEVLMVNLECFHHTTFTIWSNGSMLFSVMFSVTHHHHLYFPFIHFRVHSQGCGNSQV